jgi:hypothetical protein
MLLDSDNFIVRFVSFLSSTEPMNVTISRHKKSKHKKRNADLIVDFCSVNLTKNELLREFEMLPDISNHFEKLIMPKANNYKHHCHFASGSFDS